MRNIAARFERLEDALGALGCTCPPLSVLLEAADSPLSQDETEARMAARAGCPVHARPTGLLVIIRRFGGGALTHTGNAPNRRGHGRL